MSPWPVWSCHLVISIRHGNNQIKIFSDPDIFYSDQTCRCRFWFSPSLQWLYCCFCQHCCSWDWPQFGHGSWLYWQTQGSLQWQRNHELWYTSKSMVCMQQIWLHQPLQNNHQGYQGMVYGTSCWCLCLTLILFGSPFTFDFWSSSKIPEFYVEL